MPKQPVQCDICEATPARWNDLIDATLCEECRELPEYKLRYKTTLKNMYFVTDKDLEGLEKFETDSNGNTGYKRGQTLTLYREQDVRDKFCLKHYITEDDIDDKLEELDGRKQVRTNKREAKKELDRTKRKRKLLKSFKL